MLSDLVMLNLFQHLNYFSICRNSFRISFRSEDSDIHRNDSLRCCCICFKHPSNINHPAYACGFRRRCASAAAALWRTGWRKGRRAGIHYPSFIHSCSHASVHPPIHSTNHPSIHSSTLRLRLCLLLLLTQPYNNLVVIIIDV